MEELVMRRLRAVVGAALILASLVLAPGATATQPDAFPETIALPNGWLPEGIATGNGPIIYSGSRANGAIYRADLRTGQGSILVPGQAGRVAVGLAFDARTGYLYVAGGPTGNAYVYDTATGAQVRELTLVVATTETFVNDVIVTRDAAYFTDSFSPVLYRLPLGAGGQPGEPDTVQELPLGGAFTFVPGDFNANGIEATADGRALIIVHTALGVLYRVDPTSGDASLIDLGGASVSAGDGLLLQGQTLYVVRNELNQVAVVELDAGLTMGVVAATLTDPRLDTPTTIAAFGDRLYLVNARFTTPPTPTTSYTIVQLPAGSRALPAQPVAASPASQQNPGTINITKTIVDAGGSVVAGADRSGFVFGFGLVAGSTVRSPDFTPATAAAGTASMTLAPGTYRLFEQARAGCTVRDVLIDGAPFPGANIDVMTLMSNVEFTIRAGQTVAIRVNNTCGAATGMGMMAAGPTRSDRLVAGCNNLALTFPPGTPLRTVAQSVSAGAQLTSIFRLDAASRRFLGFSLAAPDFANDYTMVGSRLEAVFICVGAAGTLTQPEV
jgi:sugar lactone lactonase YvrE